MHTINIILNTTDGINSFNNIFNIVASIAIIEESRKRCACLGDATVPEESRKSHGRVAESSGCLPGVWESPRSLPEAFQES